MMIFGGVGAGGPDWSGGRRGNGREPDGTGSWGQGEPDGRGGRGWQGTGGPDGSCWGWWGRRLMAGSQMGQGSRAKRARWPGGRGWLGA